MRRALFVLLALTLPLAIPAQEPQPNPNHGPYYGKNVVCYRGETQLDAKPKGLVHCECKSPCDNDNVEDKACQTYCGRGEQCVCHADSCEGMH